MLLNFGIKFFIIFYNNFKNVITQIPQAQQIIPVKNAGAAQWQSHSHASIDLSSI